MKNKIFYLFITLFMLVITAESFGQKITKQQKSKIENQVNTIFQEMIAAAENMDYDKLSTGVDDSQNAGFIVGNVLYVTYDSLIHVLKDRSQGVSGQTIQIKKQKITVLTENIVLLSATGNANVKLERGDTIQTTFFWSFVYQKIGDKWMVVQSHQSNK